jgi:hypothetical protein
VQAAQTDAAGSFLFLDVPFGSLELSISAKNFQEHRIALNAEGSSAHTPLELF